MNDTGWHIVVTLDGLAKSVILSLGIGLLAWGGSVWAGWAKRRWLGVILSGIAWGCLAYAILAIMEAFMFVDGGL